ICFWVAIRIQLLLLGITTAENFVVFSKLATALRAPINHAFKHLHRIAVYLRSLGLHNGWRDSISRQQRCYLVSFFLILTEILECEFFRSTFPNFFQASVRVDMVQKVTQRSKHLAAHEPGGCASETLLLPEVRYDIMHVDPILQSFRLPVLDHCIPKCLI